MTKPYDEDKKAEALVTLAFNGMDFDLTAEETGIGKATLHRWWSQDHHLTPRVGPILQAGIFRALHRLENEKNSAAETKALSISFGILFDKYARIEGIPLEGVPDANGGVTNNIGVDPLLLVESIEMIKTLSDRIRELERKAITVEKD